ncbi:HupE/UreJ family protein [Planomicrobium sp. CPCC 101110]|uniref:HupE/UreJ family protein n=1 Tax=Planomicrobium sp. CPCC 101110 TaxID=2599619 RepID=UPI0011B4E4DD|nr:HupE/UreJ family protein [Planomicrobium sp. CPCC 101110]TWT27283.1 HupE/UreJ family protein [Planomicrobium sp. CPCC 101110]
MIKQITFIAMSLLMAVLLIAPSSTSAHSMPSSVVYLDFLEDRVEAELVIPLDRLEIAMEKSLYDDPEQAIVTYQDELVSYITSHISAETAEAEQWTVTVDEMSLLYPDKETDPIDLAVQLILTPPAGAAVDSFTLNYDAVVRELVTHTVTVAVRSDWNNAIYTSSPEIVASVIEGNTTVQIDQSAGNTWTGFISIVQSGMAHIAEGVDHLLFLLALLLPAPLAVRGKGWGQSAGVKSSVKQLLKITLAFTIGHSITLIAGATGWLAVPSQPIEVLIAVSILVSAVHAIRPIFTGREVFVAGGFGLVHGLAFAALVTELGVTPMRIIWSVLGFNIGIELMQLIVILLIMPWLLILSGTKGYAFVRLAGALFAIAASIGWILDRAFAVSTPVDTIVSALAQNVGWLVGALAVFAGISLALKKRNRSIIHLPEEAGS